MITPKHIEAFRREFPGCTTVDLPNASPDAVYALLVGGNIDGPVAVFAMLVDRIPPHVHQRLTHTYILTAGKLQLNRLSPEGAPNRFTIAADQVNPVSVTVHQNEPHAAWSLDPENPATVIVIAQPGNLCEDLHDVGAEAARKLMNGHSF